VDIAHDPEATIARRLAAYVLGGALTIVAAIVGATHFCIPSLVYNKLFRPRPTAGASVPRGA
jgi:hypothetical protein